MRRFILERSINYVKESKLLRVYALEYFKMGYEDRIMDFLMIKIKLS